MLFDMVFQQIINDMRVSTEHCFVFKQTFHFNVFVRLHKSKRQNAPVLLRQHTHKLFDKQIALLLETFGISQHDRAKIKKFIVLARVKFKLGVDEIVETIGVHSV